MRQAQDRADAGCQRRLRMIAIRPASIGHTAVREPASQPATAHGVVRVEFDAVHPTLLAAQEIRVAHAWYARVPVCGRAARRAEAVRERRKLSDEQASGKGD